MTYVTSPPARELGLDLAQLNTKFDRAYPKEILAWCGRNLPSGLVQMSDFNIDDLAITDLLYRQIKPANPVPVVFIDTLHHFRETLDFVQQAQHFYNLDLHVCKIKGINSRKTFAAKYGQALWETDLEKFHYLTKIEPLRRGLESLKAVAWITGRRRDRLQDPSHLPIFEWDKQGRLKINPLANWSRTESWAYVYEYDTIYNPLHDRGYPSIGDEPLTFKVCESETEHQRHGQESEKIQVLIHTNL
jgi:phosphoadenosine phosphosulfate reductase